MSSSAFSRTVNAFPTALRSAITKLGVGLVALVMFAAVIASAQTNAAKSTPVAVWKLDLQHSDVGSDPPPKSLTLTILKDTPTMSSWRVDLIDDKGHAMAILWSGPLDGTMQPVKTPDGKELGKESLKKDAAGATLRHGVDPDGSTFDARSTVSADGNTLTDVVTSKSKAGKVEKTTWVMRRAPTPFGTGKGATSK
jgi:hypothetical protein